MTSSLLYSATEQVVDLCAAKHRLYSYQKDFAALWQLLETDDPLVLQQPHVVIMDGWPEQESHPLLEFKRYLTARDWAIAFSIHVAEIFQQPIEFKIILLDAGLMLDEHSEAALFFQRFPEQEINDLPWLTILSWPNTHKAQNLSQLTQIISNNESYLLEVHSVYIQYWRSLLLPSVNSANHHSLSNLIAPFMLIGDMQGDQYVQALKQFLQVLKLVPDTQQALVPWIPEQLENELRETLKQNNLRLLLVDDHLLQQGWGEVVCRSVGVTEVNKVDTPTAEQTFVHLGETNDGFIEVCGSSSPASLLTQVAKPSVNFGFHADKYQEILLLDLRLFPKNGQQEGDFFLQLVTIVKQLPNKLAWQGFEDEEIDLVEEVAKALRNNDNTVVESPAYHLALTFLPRLIALNDCSLPIILFSSTGRREIIEKLLPYGNIITCFEKPRFFAGSDDIATETAAKFQQAMRLAQDFLAVRVLASKFLALPAQVRKPVFTLESSAQQAYTAELFIDESGNESSKQMTLGGLLVICPPGVDAKTILDDGLTDELKNIVKNKFSCREKREQIATGLNQLVGKHNIYLAGIAVQGQTAETKALYGYNASVFQQEFQLDNLHRELTRNLIETSIYHFTRLSIPLNSFIEYKVYTATRIGYEEDTLKVEEARNKWGVEYNTDKTRYSKGFGEKAEKTEGHMQYLSVTGTARTLVEQVMQEYSQLNALPTHACGYTINSNKNQQIRLLHYFADALIDGVNYKTKDFIKNLNKERSVQSLWENGFITQYNRSLKALLYAQRLLLIDSTHYAEAMRLMAINEANAGFRTNDIRNSLQAEVQQLFHEASGEQIKQLAQRLKMPLPLELQPRSAQ